MECPYCHHELRYDGPYGRFAAHQDEKKMGEIYRCPNHEGFESEEDAMKYLESEGRTLESEGYSSWEEAACWSSTHSVSGSFYTDLNENLHDGYPC